MDMDQSSSQWTAWTAVDVFFSSIFIVELIFKLCNNGFFKQYCGDGKFFNIFDTILIVVDVIQLIIALTAPDMTIQPSASLFRVLRIFKLARLLRLVQQPIFQDLVLM